MTYSPLVLEHFQRARNVGDLPDANAVFTVVNPACGDTLELSLRVENEVITQARFRAKGCVPTIACASRITEMIQGITTAEARGLTRSALIDSLGGLPSASHHAAQLCIDVLRLALSKTRTEAATTPSHAAAASAGSVE